VCFHAGAHAGNQQEQWTAAAALAAAAEHMEAGHDWQQLDGGGMQGLQAEHAAAAAGSVQAAAGAGADGGWGVVQPPCCRE
jgi:hypothetical protein